MAFDRKRLRSILNLGLPIVGGMMSQNVLNLVDTAMVGTLGDAALAGVGMGSFVNFLAISPIIGISPAVQAIAARRLGEGKSSITARSLNGGLLVAVLLGVPMSVALFVWAPTIFSWMVEDPAVVEQGVPYLQARFCAVAAVGANFAFRGFWNGIGRSGVYFQTILLIHVLNVVISYVLIFGKLGLPELGTLGAGMGSAISVTIGTVVYFLIGASKARASGFLEGIPDRETFQSMLRLAAPSCVRQSAFAAGSTALFYIIARVGTAELAAASVLLNLMLVAVLPAMAFGMAGASLVGQAMGRGEMDDAARWGWDVVRVGVVVLAVIGAPMWMFPDVVLSGFIHDAETLAIARWPLVIIGLAMPLDAVGTVLMHSLLGAGESRSVMVVSATLQWGLFLPSAWLVGPVLGWGLLAIWIGWLTYRGLMAICFAMLWTRGGWKATVV